MSKSITMEDAIRVPIYELFGKAKEATSHGNHAKAESLCDEAWARIPEPKFGWDVSYMCVLGMVKFLRSAGKHDKAIDLVNAYLASEFYSDFEDGPYFWLGTLHYEKGDLLKAFEYFDRANKMSRGRCFVEEEAKYKQFFKAFKTQHSAPM